MGPSSLIRVLRRGVTDLALPTLKLYTEWVILTPIPGSRALAGLILRHWLRPIQPLIDRDFYLAQISDVSARRRAARDPVLHYFLIGRFLDFAPNPDFDPIFYRAHNPTLSWASHPLLHFANAGDRISNEGQTLPLLPSAAETRPAILTLHHGRGGGSSRYLQLYEENLSALGFAAFRLVRVSRVQPLFRLLNRQTGKYHGRAFDLIADEGYFLELCRQFAITRLVVNHIVDLPQSITTLIPHLCRAAKIPFDVVLHDYIMICPRLNLVDGSNFYCGEPPVEQCRVCIATSGADYQVNDPAIWRQDTEVFARAADRVIAPSDDVRKRLARYWPDREITVWNPERAQAFPDPKPPQLAKDEKLKIAVIGSLYLIKGYYVVLELARRAAAQQLPLEFILIGESMDDSLLRQHGVTVYGRYRDSALPDILRSEAPHIVLQTSICPETWSFVASAALKQALPLYSFDIGAIADRLRSMGRDTIIPLTYARDADALTQYFLSVRSRALSAAEERRPAQTVN